ncbi:unnamed protein product [Diplocarpon coronariae]
MSDQEQNTKRIKLEDLSYGSKWEDIPVAISANDPNKSKEGFTQHSSSQDFLASISNNKNFAETGSIQEIKEEHSPNILQIPQHASGSPDAQYNRPLQPKTSIRSQWKFSAHANLGPAKSDKVMAYAKKRATNAGSTENPIEQNENWGRREVLCYEEELGRVRDNYGGAVPKHLAFRERSSKSRRSPKRAMVWITEDEAVLLSADRVSNGGSLLQNPAFGRKKDPDAVRLRRLFEVDVIAKSKVLEDWQDRQRRQAGVNVEYMTLERKEGVKKAKEIIAAYRLQRINARRLVSKNSAGSGIDTDEGRDEMRDSDAEGVDLEQGDEGSKAIKSTQL